MIQDVFEISKIEEGTLPVRRSELNLGELVAEQVLEFGSYGEFQEKVFRIEEGQATESIQED